MNKRKLDSLLWENIPIDNFIVSGHSDIKQENLDDVFGMMDELCVNREIIIISVFRAKIFESI